MVIINLSKKKIITCLMTMMMIETMIMIIIDGLYTVLRPAQEFFTYNGDATIADEGLQNLGLCSTPRA
jgi:hypothetical protein